MGIHEFPVTEDAGFIIDVPTGALIIICDKIRRNDCSEALKSLLKNHTPIEIVGVVFAPGFDGKGVDGHIAECLEELSRKYPQFDAFDALCAIERDNPDLCDCDINMADDVLPIIEKAGIGEWNMASEFFGTVEPLDKKENSIFPLPPQKDYSGEELLYIEPNWGMYSPCLKVSYPEFDDLVEEYEGKLSRVLPKEFPFKRNVVSIEGTGFN